MLVCAQRHRDHYPVQGSGRRPYVVKMFRENQLPECTCIGFMTKRNKNANIIGGGYAGAGAGMAKSTAAWCKHTQLIKDETCDWEQGTGQRQLQCPKCGGPVVDSTAPRLPAGRGPVSPGSVPRGLLPRSAAVNRASRTPKSPPLPPQPKLPSPDALIKIVQELQAKSETDEPEPPKARSGNSMFERITGKSEPLVHHKGAAVPIPPETDPKTAAAQLAALLKDA